MNYRAVTPRVWHIEEDYRVYCTLVRGERLAILWDTGQGKGDWTAFLTQHVTTPCLVLHSHGHADHVGGDRFFPLIHLHRADWPLLARQGLEAPGCRVEDLVPGTAFDLGGLHARVVSLAGHTKGSMGLLLEEEGLLLAGDGLNPTLLMLDGDSAPVSVLRRTLEATLALPFDRFLATHYPTPQPKKLVAAHLHHLDCLRTEPPSHPGPYGPRVCRSIHKDPAGRSVIFIHKGLVE